VVAVGTSNDLKVRAVSRVFKRYFDVKVVKVPVNVSVSPQPVGITELIKGALERAYKALSFVTNADFGIGIEAGLLEFYTSTGFLETQVALILSSKGRISMGLSPSFELPKDVVEEMVEGIELAEASGIRRGKRDLGEIVGYVGVRTWGALTRLELTEMAVRVAIIPWLEGESEWLITLEELVRKLGIKEKLK